MKRQLYTDGSAIYQYKGYQIEREIKQGKTIYTIMVTNNQFDKFCKIGIGNNVFNILNEAINTIEEVIK